MTTENEIILRGTLEKIVYSNDENGYTVARLVVGRKEEPVTIIGYLSGVREGELVQASGKWEKNRKFGDQFRVERCQIVPPSTTEGIEKYLASGLIKGIGPVMAARIVQRFGTETLRVLNENPKRLREVPGIGRKTLEKVIAGWDQQKELREAMIFLQSLGISPAYAGRIIKQYGNDAVRVVRENPYQLTYDVYGIGFKQADAIAQRMGMPHDSPQRAGAAAIHVLSEAAGEGHVFVEMDELLERCQRLLSVPRPVVEAGIPLLVSERKAVVEDINSKTAVYLYPLHVAETGSAKLLHYLRSSMRLLPSIHAEKAARWFEKRHRIVLNEGQRRAIQEAVASKILIITGGPGTGKTTIVRALVEIFRAKEQKILLAAPTGRAAKRMEASAGMPAMTIHRLLEYSPATLSFTRDQGHPLECDLLIIDEVSMLDIALLYHLLKAVPPEAGIIFIGDVDQLPSVGPGNVLKDFIESGFADVVRLTEIFRQEEGSLIISNAHRINRGEAPLMPRGETASGADFHFLERENPEEVVSTIEELVCHRIPDAFKMNPLLDIQVLSPMHKGSAGIASLNARLQQLLNPSGKELAHGSRVFRAGDKVMQVKNNYEKEVFNGDIGLIYSVDSESQQAAVDFERRVLVYEYAELEEIELAYAISVHKSQGSEYRAVVMPIITQHYVLLQRNLLYTAVTRAKELVVLVGTREALKLAVENAKIQRRNTLLSRRLRS